MVPVPTSAIFSQRTGARPPWLLLGGSWQDGHPQHHLLSEGRTRREGSRTERRGADSGFPACGHPASYVFEKQKWKGSGLPPCVVEGERVKLTVKVRGSLETGIACTALSFHLFIRMKANDFLEINYTVRSGPAPKSLSGLIATEVGFPGGAAAQVCGAGMAASLSLRLREQERRVPGPPFTKPQWGNNQMSRALQDSRVPCNID